MYERGTSGRMGNLSFEETFLEGMSGFRKTDANGINNMGLMKVLCGIYQNP